MSHLDPTGVLREEHRWILNVAGALEKELDRGSAGSSDPDQLERCVRFIRLFADACHHGKEEDQLFPVLEEHGFPRDSGPIAVMLAEHREGRRLAAIMKDALPAIRQGDRAAMECFHSAGRDYTSLIRGHIGKEDGVLFQMADQVISAPACARLCEAYERTCASKFEGCTKAELEDLGREILAHAGGAS
jgi:hemerythrin-like domain-containing protein